MKRRSFLKGLLCLPVAALGLGSREVSAKKNPLLTVEIGRYEGWDIYEPGLGIPDAPEIDMGQAPIDDGGYFMPSELYFMLRCKRK